MSTFENPSYEWRETYFVLLDAGNRPTLADVEQAIAKLNDSFEISDQRPDDDGKLGSFTIVAPNEAAAMDISYIEGQEVTEQMDELQKQLEPMIEDDDEKQKLAKMMNCNARVDVMHFERLGGFVELDEEIESQFDPAALLVVLEKLIKITRGVGVDPQSSILY